MQLRSGPLVQSSAADSLPSVRKRKPSFHASPPKQCGSFKGQRRNNSGLTLLTILLGGIDSLAWQVTQLRTVDQASTFIHPLPNRSFNQRHPRPQAKSSLPISIPSTGSITPSSGTLIGNEPPDRGESRVSFPITNAANQKSAINQMCQ